jgi:hypothetical protein
MSRIVVGVDGSTRAIFDRSGDAVQDRRHAECPVAVIAEPDEHR